MKAWEALKLLHEGKKVRMEGWAPYSYIVLKNGNLCNEMGYAVDNPDWFFSSNREWEELKEWVHTEKRSTETREFMYVRCPYCSAEVEMTVHNGLVKIYNYCPCCGKRVF